MEILEREDDLARLLSSVDVAAEGRGSLVLVPGEAGIGKTTLVRMLREAVRGRASMAVGACEPLSVPEPLGPFRDVSTVIPGLEASLVRADAPALARALCAGCADLRIGGGVSAARWQLPDRQCVPVHASAPSLGSLTRTRPAAAAPELVLGAAAPARGRS